jgi:CubicO group peptidase (beta-lactamase class C family)
VGELEQSETFSSSAGSELTAFVLLKGRSYGMMGEPQAAVQALLDELVASGEETGLQAAVYKDGELVVDAWAGAADPESGKPVTPETLFTVFSVSKGIAATALHLLAERGLAAYDEPIATYWPEFAQNGKEGVLVRHALSHTSGIPHVPEGTTRDDLLDWRGMQARMAGQTPLWAPGETLCYHALTYGWVVGGLAERVDGRPFARFVAEEIAAPLGLDGLFFGVPATEISRVATLGDAPELLVAAAPSPVSNIAPEGSLSAAEMNRPEARQAVLPAYGLCANARSLAKVYAALIGEGVDGVRLLPPERVAQASALQVDAVNASSGEPLRFGLGYRIGGGATPWLSARGAAFGHDGHGGALAYAEPEHGLAVGFTKNRLVMTSPGADARSRVIQTIRQSFGIPE